MGEWGWMKIFYGWVGVGRGRWRYILGGWEWVDIFYWWVGCVEVYFRRMGIFMGGWGWMEVYFGWVVVDGHFLWVGGGWWW